MDIRIGLASLGVAILCAAGVQLGAPRWMWAVAAGVAVGLLVYSVVVRREVEDAKVDETESKESNSKLGPGAASNYYGSQVFNVNLEGKRNPNPPP